MKKGSMTCKIPPKLREEMANDPFYKECVIKELEDCEGIIEWNHALIFAGKRQNKKFCIIPMCKKHHDQEAKWRYVLRVIMKLRATEQDKKDYKILKWLQ